MQFLSLRCYFLYLNIIWTLTLLTLPNLCTVSLLLYLMVLKTIFPGCGVRASLMLFFYPRISTCTYYSFFLLFFSSAIRSPLQLSSQLCVVFIWFAVYGELQNTDQFQTMSVTTDEDEHSIEMHLPYIAKVMERSGSHFDFSLVQIPLDPSTFVLHCDVVQ